MNKDFVEGVVLGFAMLVGSILFAIVCFNLAAIAIVSGLMIMTLGFDAYIALLFIASAKSLVWMDQTNAYIVMNIYPIFEWAFLIVCAAALVYLFTQKGDGHGNN